MKRLAILVLVVAATMCANNAKVLAAVMAPDEAALAPRTPLSVQGC